MNYKGAYASGTSYSVDDVVVYTDNVPYYLQNPAVAGTTPHDKRYWARVPQPLCDSVMMFHSMLTSINAYIADDPGTEENISKMIAPEYTKTTYTKGAIRTHNGKLYQAKQDIGTAENWTAAHWEEITVGATLTALNAAAATIPDNINDEAITLTSGDHDYLITVDTTGGEPDLTVTQITEGA